MHEIKEEKLHKQEGTEKHSAGRNQGGRRGRGVDSQNFNDHVVKLPDGKLMI